MENLLNEQKEICIKYDFEFSEIDVILKIGISQNLIDFKEYPIHGLRHKPDENTSGWFIWTGEYSKEDDFFVPIHIFHLKKFIPEIQKYLCLPPGCRFLVDDKGYEDVWFDECLI
jgi:hypothetical protein